MTGGKNGSLPLVAPEGAIRSSPVLAGRFVSGWRRAAATSGRLGRRVTEPAARLVSTKRAGVLIADSEMLVRAGLRSVIEHDAAFEVVAEATEGTHALELAVRLGPRLAIIGTGLHEPAGIEVARRMRKVAPSTAVVLFARHDDSRSLLEGFRAGATGFIRSDIGRLELMAALRRALAGESVVDSAAAAELIVRLAAESELTMRATPDPLTPREVEILTLVAQGQTNRQIADRLILAVGTIKVHVEHILDKLGAADRTQAAVRAVELGIVRPEEGEGSAASPN